MMDVTWTDIAIAFMLTVVSFILGLATGKKSG